jgi:hypothetical protein
MLFFCHRSQFKGKVSLHVLHGARRLETKMFVLKSKSRFFVSLLFFSSTLDAEKSPCARQRKLGKTSREEKNIVVYDY